MEYKPVARSSEIVVQEVGNETLVYDTKTHNAKCLNETSAMIWKLCDGNKNAIDITIALSAQLKTKVDENLVWLAFDQLQKEELFENDNELVFVLKGASRRELIKKAGFAAVVALPIVSTVVAPVAANAQSGPFTCGPNGGIGCLCAGGAAGPANTGTQNCIDFIESTFMCPPGSVGPQHVDCNESHCLGGGSVPAGYKCCDLTAVPLPAGCN